MEHIYAPWRAKYFEQEIEGCPFCEIALHIKDDEKNFVFYRDEICYGVMNRYPYTPGHILLIPHCHIDSPSNLSALEWAHISAITQKSTVMLEAFGAQGINIGANIKVAGGAGIPEHLHIGPADPSGFADPSKYRCPFENEHRSIWNKAVSQSLRLLLVD